jgi:hypothetical protein
MADDEAITADVPTRLQPDPTVHQPDGADRVHVGLIEAGGEQPDPVLALRFARPFHRRVALEHPGQIRVEADMLVEPGQDLRQRALQGRQELRQDRTRRRVDPQECKPFGELGIGGHRAPLRGCSNHRKLAPMS